MWFGHSRIKLRKGGSEPSTTRTKLSYGLSYEPKGWERLMRDQIRSAVAGIYDDFDWLYFRDAAVMWNPADDRLVHIDNEIVDLDGAGVWDYSGEVFTVLPGGE